MRDDNNEEIARQERRKPEKGQEGRDQGKAVRGDMGNVNNE